MLKGVLTFAMCLLLPLPAPADANIQGQPSVIDGDTIEIHGQRIRLFGIDSPESGQLCFAASKQWRCGQQSALALDRKIAGRPLTCTEKDRDRYGRIVAVCRLAGEDLNAWLVAEGWAIAYRHYSLDYVDEEDEASRAFKGLWAGLFVRPWDWRRGKRLQKASASTGDCHIKGNIKPLPAVRTGAGWLATCTRSRPWYLPSWLIPAATRQNAMCNACMG